MSEPTGPAKPRAAKGSSKASQESQEPAAVDVPAEGAPTQETPAPATPTQPLPAAAGAVPAVSEAAPAGPPAAGPPPAGPPAAGPPAAGPPPAGPRPAGPPGGPPHGTPPGGPTGPVGPYGGGPVGPPPKGPGLWRQATSTTGGLIAVVVAAALAVLLVLGLVGTLGLVAVRALGHDGPDRVDRVRDDGQRLPPGQQRKLDRMPPGPDSQGRNGNGNDRRDGMGPGGGMGPGNGMGELMRGAMGLGAVQHGEFTVQQDGKAVVMTLQRGAVTKVSDTSVTVKSDDAFTATYVLSDDTRGRTGALAVGDDVLVVAEKAGARAVMVTVSRRS